MHLILEVVPELNKANLLWGIRLGAGLNTEKELQGIQIGSYQGTNPTDETILNVTLIMMSAKDL
jgi:hypothetical protein